MHNQVLVLVGWGRWWQWWRVSQAASQSHWVTVELGTLEPSAASSSVTTSLPAVLRPGFARALSCSYPANEADTCVLASPPWVMHVYHRWMYISTAGADICP